MNRQSAHNQRTGRVPQGTPRWITAELIGETVSAWQPYYEQALSEDDAVEILLNVTNLFEQLDARNSG